MSAAKSKEKQNITASQFMANGTPITTPNPPGKMMPTFHCRWFQWCLWGGQSRDSLGLESPETIETPFLIPETERSPHGNPRESVICTLYKH